MEVSEHPHEVRHELMKLFHLLVIVYVSAVRITRVSDLDELGQVGDQGESLDVLLIDWTVLPRTVREYQLTC